MVNILLSRSFWGWQNIAWNSCFKLIIYVYCIRIFQTVPASSNLALYIVTFKFNWFAIPSLVFNSLHTGISSRFPHAERKRWQKWVCFSNACPVRLLIPTSTDDFMLERSGSSCRSHSTVSLSVPVHETWAVLHLDLHMDRWHLRLAPVCAWSRVRVCTCVRNCVKLCPCFYLLSFALACMRGCESERLWGCFLDILTPVVLKFMLREVYATPRGQDCANQYQ